MKTNLLLQEYLTLMKNHIEFWCALKKVAQKGDFQVGVIIAFESGRNMTDA